MARMTHDANCKAWVYPSSMDEGMQPLEVTPKLREAAPEVYNKYPCTCGYETYHPLNDLAARVHKANAKWWVDLNTGEPLKRNVGELLMLTVSELAEAMEGDRKNLMDDKLPHRKMFEVEIADAIIRIFDIAGGMGLDLGGAFEEKMAFNAVRADHSIEGRKAADGKKY